MLNHMLDDHRRLLVLADQLEAHLADDFCPSDLNCLSRTRWALARELIQHLAVEDQYLGARLSTANAGVRALAQAYFADWTADRIVPGWDDYRVATLKLLRTLRARIAHEERDIYPTFAQIAPLANRVRGHV